jgi:outer membrane protein assembly factor BamE (lipoprotein component of BamABCDE complex)
MNTLRIWTLALLTCTLVGCASPGISIGRPFDDRYVAELKPEETTKEQVRARLGEPWRQYTTQVAETWTYSYSDDFSPAPAARGTAEGVDARGRHQLLIIAFKGERVSEFAYSK